MPLSSANIDDELHVAIQAGTMSIIDTTKIILEASVSTSNIAVISSLKYTSVAAVLT